MSKRQLKSHASSSRAASATPNPSFGQSLSSSFATPTSPLSYLNELPDLSAISDANIVVLFKNLSKKDSTTKAKALEDLQSLIPKDEIEDAVLEAWISIYPRTSIDNSRRVRQLAHAAHGQIAAASGKKIAKYMSRAIGAWLLGLYDNDKLVAKAAQDALEQVFPTADKLRALRKAYQEPILEFVRSAIEKDTPQTLSDERSVSPDEAAAKYARVIAASIGLLSSLLAELQEQDFQKFKAQYDDLFSMKSLWEFAVHEDTSVRKATHKLLRTYLQKWNTPAPSGLDMLSSVYIYKGLNSDQSTSASDYLESLTALTQRHPTIWTTHYHGKKLAKSHLRHFFKRGSQGSASSYWGSIITLFVFVPNEVLPTNPSEAEDLLKALHTGFTKKEEPRAFIVNGFRAYICLGCRLKSAVPENDRSALLENAILPILRQFINQDPSKTSWNIPGPSVRELMDQILNLDGMVQLAAKMLPEISEKLVSQIQASLPEQSKDYGSSQDELASLGERYALLIGSCLKARKSELVQDSIFNCLLQVVSPALETCKTRNGKPYGATAVVSAIVLSCPRALEKDSEIALVLDEFAKKDLAQLIMSPSSNAIITLLRAANGRPAFREAQISALKSVTEAPEPLRNVSTFTDLVKILSNTQPEQFEHLKPTIQEFVASCVSAALEDTDIATQRQDRWKSISNLLSSSQYAGNAIDHVLASLTENLTLEEEGKAINALEGLQIMSKKSPAILGTYINTPQSKLLLQKLLLLTESPNDHVAHLATELNASLHANIDQMPYGTTKSGNMLDIIHSNLNDASLDSVSVETLMGHVHTLLKQSDSITKRALVPSTSIWKQALEPFLTEPPTTAFAITNHIGGALYLLHDGAETMSPKLPSVPRDSDGVSIPVRMALYCVALMRDVISYHDLDEETCADLFKMLYVTLLLINEDQSIRSSHGLWIANLLETEVRMLRLHDLGMELVNNWLRDSIWKDSEGQLSSSVVRSTFGAWMTEPSEGLTSAYYHAEARSAAVSELIDIHGWPSKLSAELDTAFRSLSKSPDTIRLCDFIVEHKVPLANSSAAQRFCNELVADLTYADLSNESDKILRKLIVLNIMLQHLEGMDSIIAKQRVVFFVKKAITWLQEDTLSDAHVAELCKLLTVLLSDMSDIYGDHWADILAYIVNSWQMTVTMGERSICSQLPAIHSTLRLFSFIRRLKGKPEPNEDLVEAWAEAEGSAASGLLNLLKLSRQISDEDHQPLKIVDELLARLVTSVPMKLIQDTSDLFPLMVSNSEAIQQAAYHTLHKQIPEQQQQISIDTALDNKAARLPDELLSLILETPQLDGLDKIELYGAIPLHLRSYLLSWLLVFDHFQNAVSMSNTAEDRSRLTYL